MKFYSDWALRIASGQWTDYQAFYGLPGYAYVLALIFKLAGGFDPFFVGGCQAVLDAGVAVLIWRTSLLVFATAEPEADTGGKSISGTIIGIGAALAWALFTPAQAFSTVMMPTIWLVFAYSLCLWFAVKTRESSIWNPWLGLGLFIGLVAMMVATILFAVPLLIAAMFKSVARDCSWSVRLSKCTCACAVLVGGIYTGAAPAWIHNHFVAHEPVMLSAHSGINFWIGNNPTATGYPKMPPGIRATQEGLLRDSITLAEAAAQRKMTRAEVSAYWSDQANRYIAAHPGAWFRLLATKFGNFWNAYQYDDLSIIKLLRDEMVLPSGLKFGFVAALGLAGIIPVLLRFPRAGWVAAAVLLHMAALMPVFVTERYRLAAVPGSLILGAAGLWLFWENIARARWIAAGTYLCLCLGAGWFVSIPIVEIGLWSLDHYKAGIRATTGGDLDRAQRNLETAYAYVPNNPDIDFALGNMWLARSAKANADESKAVAAKTNAKLYYRLALDLDARHAGTLNNLGVLATEEKRWELAERFFSGALEVEPEDAKTHFLLARVRLERNDLIGAESALAHALKARPNQKEFLVLRDRLAEKMKSAKPPANLPGN